MNLKSLIIGTIFLCFYAVMQGQSLETQVINTSGNQMTNQNINLVYNLGEMFITTHLQDDLLLTEGLIQPRLSVATQTASTNSVRNIQIFPNPCTSLLNIHSGDIKLTTMEIHDLLGKTILSLRNTSTVNVDQLPSGVYFISFFDDKHQLIEQEKFIKIAEK